MITKEKINELRSEAARVGYHNLNLAPVMHHAKSAVQKAYIDQKKTLSMRIKRYLSVRDSISKHTSKLKQQMKNTIIDSGDMLSTVIMAAVTVSLVYLWKNLMMIPITDEYLVPFGLIIAGTSLGGIYTFIQKRQKKEVSKEVISVIVGCVILITFLFTLQSGDKIYAWKSGAVAIFTGVIVYVINKSLIPACKGTVKTIFYALKGCAVMFISLGNIYVNQGANRTISKLKTIKGEIVQQIEKIESMLILDFMLAQRASGIEPSLIEDKKEKHYA